MSIRELTTYAVDCNGCDDSFTDCLEMPAGTAVILAERAGWTELETDDGRLHYCPSCSRMAEAAMDAASEMDELYGPGRRATLDAVAKLEGRS